MGGEWKKVPVAAVAEPVLGGTPAKAKVEYWEGGTIPWATAKDISLANGRFIYDTERKITERGLANSAAKLLPPGTIVITARGTVGAIARLGYEMTFNQTCYGLVPIVDHISEDYLFYALKATLPQMRSLAYGTVFETITKKSFHSWDIPLPSLPEQRAIARILGTLDDKIELNRRMNATLEAMAQALFKSFFLDFDPVVVNALKAGNPIPDKFAERAAHYRENPDALGLPEPILRLFPDRFVDSELGPIPEGWKTTTIGRLAHIASGKRPKVRHKKLTQKAQIPVWGGNGPMAYTDQSLVEEPIILTGRVGTLGCVFRISSSCWPSDNTLILRPVSSVFFDFIYFWLHTIDFSSLNRGSTQPLLARSDLQNQIIIEPSERIILAFSSFTGALFAKVESLAKQAKTLAQLRDTLLPKLISGELRVPEVERFLAEAGV